MPAISITVDDSRLVAHLDAIGPNVREALVRALRPLADEAAESARAIAAEHIHTLGKSPGLYLASIYGGVFEREGAVGGYVRSASPVAHLLEYGADVPPHQILPAAADVLAFEGDAGEVFAKVVHSPGAAIPAYPAIHPAFSAASDAIRDALVEAVKTAAR